MTNQTTQTNVTGTGAVTIIPAGADYRDLVALVLSTTNAAAATVTISDGAKTVLVINFPATAATPVAPVVIPFTDAPLSQSKISTAWMATVSVNASGVQVTAVWQERY